MWEGEWWHRQEKGARARRTAVMIRTGVVGCSISWTVVLDCTRLDWGQRLVLDYVLVLDCTLVLKLLGLSWTAVLDCRLVLWSWIVDLSWAKVSTWPAVLGWIAVLALSAVLALTSLELSSYA